MSDHLTPIRSDRGFISMPAIVGAYAGEVTVYESSAAESPHIWLRVDERFDRSAEPKDATAHLTMESARQLAEQLLWLCENHYQVKSFAHTNPKAIEQTSVAFCSAVAPQEDLRHIPDPRAAHTCGLEPHEGDHKCKLDGIEW